MSFYLLICACKFQFILLQEGEIVSLTGLAKGCETHFRIPVRKLASSQRKDFKDKDIALNDLHRKGHLALFFCFQIYQPL